jgi:hypothetical protein
MRSKFCPQKTGQTKACRFSCFILHTTPSAHKKRGTFHHPKQLEKYAFPGFDFNCQPRRKGEKIKDLPKSDNFFMTLAPALSIAVFIRMIRAFHA